MRTETLRSFEWLLSRLPSVSPRSQCCFLALSGITYRTVPWTQMLWALRTSTEQPGWPTLTTSFRLSQRASTRWWGRKECSCQVRRSAHTWFSPPQEHVFTSLSSFCWKTFLFGEDCYSHIVIIHGEKKKKETLNCLQTSPFVACISFSRRSEAEDSHSQSTAQGEHNTFVLRTHPVVNWPEELQALGFYRFLWWNTVLLCCLSPQNPRILLLDEATRWLRNSFTIQWTKRSSVRLIRLVWTLWWHCLLPSIPSALDAENELLVQEALERLMEGKKNLMTLLFVLLWKDCVADMFTIPYSPKEEQLWLSLTACPPSRTLTLWLYWTSSMSQRSASTQSCWPTGKDCSENWWRNRYSFKKNRNKHFTERRRSCSENDESESRRWGQSLGEKKCLQWGEIWKWRWLTNANEEQKKS